jgi:hypothetical protein
MEQKMVTYLHSYTMRHNRYSTLLWVDGEILKAGGYYSHYVRRNM